MFEIILLFSKIEHFAIYNPIRLEYYYFIE